MTLIVREVSTVDLDDLWKLIEQSSIGMTSLQVDRDQLADRIERAHFAFRRTMEKPEGAPYVFVMEELESNRIVGTSCIFSRTGGFEPFYSYRVVSETHHCDLLDRTQTIRSLHLVKTHDGPTELGGLFLLPEFRGAGGGKLLSLSRFLYMAAHPRRFVDETIAEMRGYIDMENESPFWNAIGSHFFQVDFPRADALSMIDKQFIEDLMPKYPIYLDLLPSNAVDSIGRVHDQTRPALALLESHGFHRRDLIDIFDGGPIVHCRTREIRGIAQARKGSVASITDDVVSHPQANKALISSELPRFRSVVGQVVIDNDEVSISKLTAELLACSVGDLIWCLTGN